MTSELPPPDPGEIPRTGRRPQSPNYTVRRVALGSGVIAVLAVAAVAMLVFRGGAGDDDVGVTSPSWDSMVEVDRTSGDVVVLDADGEEVSTTEGDGRVTEVFGRADRLALVGNGGVTLVGVDGGDPVEVPVDPSTSVVRHPSNRSFTLVVSPDVGGEIVIVDGNDGTVTELGARAGQSTPLLLPETLRIDRTGTRFAVGDGRNFQTIVIDADPEVEAGFFPGIPMAVGEVVVTSTNVGRTAELGFFDGDGDRLGLVTTERPVAGVLDGTRFVYVTEQGALLGVAADDSSPREIAQLDVGPVSNVRPVLDGDRLVVSGSTGTVVVDLDGIIVVAIEEPLDVEPWDTWRCLPVGGENPSIVDLSSGEVLVDLEPVADAAAESPITIESVSIDGCAVHHQGDDGHVIASTAGTYAPGGAVRSVVISPDGTAVIVVASTGVAELVDLDDSRRLDLGTRRGHLVFAER